MKSFTTSTRSDLRAITAYGRSPGAALRLLAEEIDELDDRGTYLIGLSYEYVLDEPGTPAAVTAYVEDSGLGQGMELDPELIRQMARPL